jgi:hypothetical protein
MKKQVIFMLIALIFASFACSIQNVQMETIDNQIVMINEPLPADSDEAELEFQMSGGKFSLSPGAEGLVNGNITYNVEQWEPEFTRSSNHFAIKQVNPYRISGIPTGDIINNWELYVTNQVPLNLSIEGGASENTFDFSGLQLTNLKVVQGASDTTIRFDLPNPALMDEFIFNTGASSAELYGLANANFQGMTISAGAGDYTLDFGGTLSRDVVVNIKAGVSNLKIIVPAATRAVVNNEGTISNINTKGTWLVTDDTYTTMVEGYTLTINLDIAVGNVTLTHEE